MGGQMPRSGARGVFTAPACLPKQHRQFQPHGLQRRQAAVDGRRGYGQQLRLKNRWRLRTWPTRAGPGRWQINHTPGVELRQQGADRHVFESAGPVAPVPQLAQMTRKHRAMPVGMLRDQGAQSRQIIAREHAALEADRFHWPQLLRHPGPRVQQKMSKLQTGGTLSPRPPGIYRFMLAPARGGKAGGPLPARLIRTLPFASLQIGAQVASLRCPILRWSTSRLSDRHH